jgi:UDP-glucose 4-epimerase
MSVDGHIIAGGAGFIAQTLIRRLLLAGDSVLVIDNLSRGQEVFLKDFINSDRFDFKVADCSDESAVEVAIKSVRSPETFNRIWHLAANSDIPAGIANPGIDLKDTFLTTFALLKLAKARNIANFHFASSSAIYGDLGDRAVDEDIGPLRPISNYGAMKLASEAQIRAAVESFLPRADIFRFPNVIGVPATHGVIVDFVRKLKSTPDQLVVLGNGTQRKPYLHADDLVDAMIFIANTARDPFNVFNIGPRDQGVTVQFIAEAVRDRVAPHCEIVYGEGDRGWVGDVPRFKYSTDRIAALGWTPRLGSREAVVRAVDEVARQEGFG